MRNLLKYTNGKWSLSLNALNFHENRISDHRADIKRKRALNKNNI